MTGLLSSNVTQFMLLHCGAGRLLAKLRGKGDRGTVLVEFAPSSHREFERCFQNTCGDLAGAASGPTQQSQGARHSDKSNSLC